MRSLQWAVVLSWTVSVADAADARTDSQARLMRSEATASRDDVAVGGPRYDPEQLAAEQDMKAKFRVLDAGGEVGFQHAPTRKSPEHIQSLWAADSNSSKAAIDGLRQSGIVISGEAAGGPGKSKGITLLQNPAPVKLVLGIMAVASQRIMRDAHHATWMKAPGVCSLDKHADPACHTFPVWVFGDLKEANVVADTSSNQAVFLKDVPEPNITEGRGGFEEDGGDHGKSKQMWEISERKTPAWFNYAKTAYPWATHVGKMDTDAYPRIHLIHSDLESGPRQGLYYGWRFAWGPPECSSGAMYGMMYLVSTDVLNCLASELNVNDPTWYHMPEDQYFGTLLMKQQYQKKCPPLSCMNIENSRRIEHPV